MAPLRQQSSWPHDAHDDADDDVCDLEAPRAGSCWTRTFLPRGVRVRTNLAARSMRRTLRDSPSALLAVVLAEAVYSIVETEYAGAYWCDGVGG